MPKPSEQSVRKILAKNDRQAKIRKAAHDAWTAYRLHKDRGWYRRKTTGAHIVWEHWVAGLIDVFSDDPGVFVLEHHDTISFIFDDSVLARAKRADRSLRTSNAQTELSDLFHDHGEDLFEYTGLQRVELVYVPDRFEKQLDWVGVVSRDGDSDLWHFELIHDSVDIPAIQFPQPSSRSPAELAKVRKDAEKKKKEDGE